MGVHLPVSVRDGLYQAAAGELAWGRALERYDRHNGAQGTVIFNLSAAAPPFCSDSLAEVTRAYVQDGWQQIDERYRIVPLMKTGKITNDLDILPAERIARLPFYQEFVFRHGLRWWAGLAVKEARREFCISIQRSARQGDFTATDFRRLDAARSDLASALVLQEARIKAREHGMLDVLDALWHAAFAVAPNGTVLRWNRRAERLLGNGIRIRDGKLSTATQAGQIAVEGLLGRAAAKPTRKPVLVPRENGPALVMSVLVDFGVTRELFSSGGAILLVNDPGAEPRRGQDILAAVFALTRAEANLAAGIAAGMSLADYAESTQLAESTARTHMKRVLEKSDTRRQGEFVALANRLLSGIGAPEGE